MKTNKINTNVFDSSTWTLHQTTRFTKNTTMTKVNRVTKITLFMRITTRSQITKFTWITRITKFTRIIQIISFAIFTNVGKQEESLGEPTGATLSVPWSYVPWWPKPPRDWLLQWWWWCKTWCWSKWGGFCNKVATSTFWYFKQNHIFSFWRKYEEIQQTQQFLQWNRF